MITHFVQIAVQHFLHVKYADTERLVMPILQKFNFLQVCSLQKADKYHWTIQLVAANVPHTASATNNRTHIWSCTFLVRSLTLCTPPHLQLRVAVSPRRFQDGLRSTHFCNLFWYTYKRTPCIKFLLNKIQDIIEILLLQSKTTSLPPEVWWGILELPLEQIWSYEQITFTLSALTRAFWEWRVCLRLNDLFYWLTFLLWQLPGPKVTNLYTNYSPYIPPFVAITKKILKTSFASRNPIIACNGM